LAPEIERRRWPRETVNCAIPVIDACGSHRPGAWRNRENCHKGTKVQESKMSSDEIDVTEFLNVDLDLRARVGLDELVAALAPAIAIHKTECEATVELAEQPQSVEDAILQFAGIVQSLPQHLRSIWDQSEMRRMNIGIQGGAQPRESHFGLSDNALSRLVSIRADLLFTVYASRSKK